MSNIAKEYQRNEDPMIMNYVFHTQIASIVEHYLMSGHSPARIAQGLRDEADLFEAAYAEALRLNNRKPSPVKKPKKNVRKK